MSCVRGNHALGELVLVEENEKDAVEMKKAPSGRAAGGRPAAVSTPNSTPKASSATSSPRYCKKRRGLNSGGDYSREREWKDMANSPEESNSPPLTLRTQPELDDVDGLTFASFDSKVRRLLCDFRIVGLSNT